MADSVVQYCPTASTHPILAFRRAMEKAHQGGTRDQRAIAENLRCSKRGLTGEVVAAVLFPNSGDASVEDDYQKFSSLKVIRDEILHGEDVSSPVQ